MKFLKIVLACYIAINIQELNLLEFAKNIAYSIASLFS